MAIPEDEVITLDDIDTNIRRAEDDTYIETKLRGDLAKAHGITDPRIEEVVWNYADSQGFDAYGITDKYEEMAEIVKVVNLLIAIGKEN